ncbi:MAG TPA: tripartite tricarboxylate transporter substrate binding protein [Burkholderiales bacterium]|nr:tripartite tricarboxylate transporter substrate binding protein [Burkholderiales bacterium]
MRDFSGIARLIAACAIACAVPMGVASAQELGSKPVRIVVGFAPGGSNDLVACALAPRIMASAGIQAIVDNRPGANGIIAAEHVAKSPADGHTLILTGVSTFVLNPLVYAKVPYDTLRDLAPVTLVAVMPQIIVAHPSLPSKTLKDVADLARRAPGTLTAAHPGVGGLSHLTLELFKSLARLQITDVSYKGTAPALTDLVGGHVPLLVADLPAPLPLVRSGKLRALAVTDEQRSPLLPEVQTAREQGYPALQATNWLGVMAPAKTPPAILERLHAAFSAAVGASDTRERYAAVGVDVATSKTPAAFGSFVREEFARWEKVVKQADVQLQ